MSTPIDLLNAALAGRYVVEREIGEGGMARVYLAHEAKHDRHVALKVLRSDLVTAVGPDRFLQEIRVTARLLHPHILPLHDSGEADGLLYYVMPFIEGETLASRLEREGQLPLEDALQITREVASALAYAHEHGVVHRDVKPDNVLFQSGKAVVADFGVARVVEEAAGSKITTTGMTTGTPLYMSPEQATGAKNLDHRSDVYSLGCILYEMLAGEPPFMGANVQTVMIKRLTDPVPSVRRLRETVPPHVDAAIQRALQRSPADRFQTADAFARALSADSASTLPFVDATEAGTEAGGTGPVLPDLRRLRARRVLVTMGGIALVVAAVAFTPALLARFRGGGDDLGAASFRQVTRDPGPELYPSLSADGATVVYSRDGDLFLRDIEGGSERRLTQEPEHDNRQPSFSPDGGRVAFRSDREGGGIFTVATDGAGDVVRLTNFGHNPAWSPDGRLVLFANEGVAEPSTRRGISNLFTVDVETGEQRQVGEVDGVQPSWSPSGARVAFWSVMRDGKLTGQRDLWTMRADGTDPVLVTDDPAVDWNPVWSADGRWILFSSDRGGSMNLWRVRVDEDTGRRLGDPEPITNGGNASHEHLAVAAGGSRTLYAERLTTSNVLRIAFDPDKGEVVGAPVAVTSGTRMAMEPSVSPDGSRVSFYTLSDPMDVYVVGTDGSGMRRLTDGEAHYRSPQWSPDGSRIVFHSDRSGSYQIWAADPEGTELTQLTRSGAPTLYAFWSPDAASVGFVELGRGISTLRTADPRAGAEMLLQGDLMVRPTWSPDGALIAGVLPPAAGGTGIVVYSLATRSLETVSTFGDAPRWLPRGRRLVFAWKNKLFLADVPAREVREIFAVERDQLGLGSVSADGRWIYFSRTVTEADLWSVEWGR